MAFDLAAQIANDLDDMDGLQTVDYVTREIDTSDNSADDTVYGNIKALPRDITDEDRDFAGMNLNAVGRVWHISKAKLDDLGIVPQRGHEIRECDADGTKWAVMGIGRQTLMTRYRLICQKGES